MAGPAQIVTEAWDFTVDWSNEILVSSLNYIQNLGDYAISIEIPDIHSLFNTLPNGVSAFILDPPDLPTMNLNMPASPNLQAIGNISQPTFGDAPDFTDTPEDLDLPSTPSDLLDLTDPGEPDAVRGCRGQRTPGLPDAARPGSSRRAEY